MIPPDRSAPLSAQPRPEMPDEAPGVPGFSSWDVVYLAVVGIFVVVVALLSMLPLLAR